MKSIRVKLRSMYLHAEAGNITENDIMLATASTAIVLGFNVQVRNMPPKD